MPSKEPFPDDEQVAASFAKALESHLEQAKVVSVMASSIDRLSPFVFAASQTQGYVVVIPLLSDSESVDSVLQSPSISQGLEVVTSLARYLDGLMAAQPQPPSMNVFWATFGLALSMAMPLGSFIRPLVAGEMLAQAGLQRRDPSDDSTAQSTDGSMVSKAPCWRVTDSATQASKRARVVVTVEETIESHQYDGALGAKDGARLFGTVSVWTDVQGPAPEVSLKVRVWSADSKLDYRGTVIDLAADPYDLTFALTQGAGINSNDRTCHVSLVPSVKFEHVVMRFNATPPVAMPFRAFYQMKPVSKTEAKVLIQLKLHDRVSNSFEYCRVVLSFEKVGAIDSFETSPTEGSVKKVDSTTLIWEIGTTIVGRKLECALPMSVKFQQEISMHSPAATSPSCYADIVFKMLESGISGVKVDADEVSVYPKPSSQQVQVVVNYALRSGGSYRIWNSLGESVRQTNAPMINQ